MTTDTEHTYGFYLIALNRIRRDIDTNRAARRQIVREHHKYTTLLQLIGKYKITEKSKNIINQIITQNQTASMRLDSDYSRLQSEFDSLRAHIQNIDDVAGHAYDAAYPENDTKNIQARYKYVPFISQIAKFFAERIK